MDVEADVGPMVDDLVEALRAVVRVADDVNGRDVAEDAGDRPRRRRLPRAAAEPEPEPGAEREPGAEPAERRRVAGFAAPEPDAVSSAHVSERMHIFKEQIKRIFKQLEDERELPRVVTGDLTEAMDRIGRPVSARFVDEALTDHAARGRAGAARPRSRGSAAAARGRDAAPQVHIWEDEQRALPVSEFVQLACFVEEQRLINISEDVEMTSRRLKELSVEEQLVRVIGNGRSWIPGMELLDPGSANVQIFDIVIMIILFIVFVTLPMSLAFEEINSSMIVANIVFDSMFMLDVVKHFNVGYFTSDMALVMDRQRIAKEYLQGWFLVDLVSSVPISDILELLSRSKGDYMALLRDAFAKMFWLFFTLLTLAHWLGCLLYFAVRLWSFPRTSWVVLAGLVTHEGTPLMNVLSRYLWCLHKILLVFVSVAYEYPATSQICMETTGWCRVESWITLLCLYIGTLFYALLISNLSAIVVNQNMSHRRFEEQLSTTLEFLRSKKIPKSVCRKVKEYYYLRYNDGRLYDEAMILDNLSPELRKEVWRCSSRELIPKVPLFREHTTAFFDALAVNLTPTMWFPGDVIVQEGSVGKHVFFIHTGLCSLHLRSVEDDDVRILADGCFFGEAAILLKTKRSCTVCDEFPEIADYLHKLARQRQTWLKHLDISRAYRGVDAKVVHPDYVDPEDALTPLFQLLHAMHDNAHAHGDNSLRHSLHRALSKKKEENERRDTRRMSALSTILHKNTSNLPSPPTRPDAPSNVLLEIDASTSCDRRGLAPRRAGPGAPAAVVPRRDHRRHGGARGGLRRVVVERRPKRLKRVPRGARPTVAIIGRPNVGKSSLVNRLCDAGKKGTIAVNEAGVKRDRVYQKAEWCGRTFDVVDTGGLLFEDEEGALFLDEIREQATLALREACACVVVVDGRAGSTRLDDDIARFLRRWPDQTLEVVLAVNKCESAEREAELVADFWPLGLGEPRACSAIHGNGVAEVLDALLPALDASIEAKAAQIKTMDAIDAKPHVNVCFLGRPNDLSDQDAALAQRVADDGRACVVLANKWDAYEDKDEASTRAVEKKIKGDAHGRRAVDAHRRRVATATLNEVIRDAMLWQPPPASAGGKAGAKIYFVSQTAVAPPTIVAMCNSPAAFTDNYKRYLERKLRESLNFAGTPVSFIFRGRRLRDSNRDAAKRSKP
ncbi:voltage-gated potassium channel [Aureococcus anophagefferens]|nr:voltage-gated potassium channel [Aureococcus anophagefferens]